MRNNIRGRSISLRDELSDAIAENLPRGEMEDEINSFCKSKEWERLLDDAIEVISLHLEAGIKEAIQ